MEFTALFLAVTVVMVVAWWGTRALALALFAATLLASVATYLYHASDVLKLSCEAPHYSIAGPDPQCAWPLRHRVGSCGRLCGTTHTRRTSLSALPAPADPVRDAGGGAYSQRPLRASPQPLCRLALRR